MSERAPGRAAIVLVASAAVAAGAACATFMPKFSRDGATAAEPDKAPPELAVRRFGRWTCGAELPWGRSTPSFELLRRLGPGRAWNLSVDADGLAALQVVGQRGRARQGCWAELGPTEHAALERSARGAALCDRPDDPRGPAGESAYDVDLRLPGLTCVRHLTAASLQRTAAGRRFTDDVRWWLDQVSNGSFQKVEAFAVAGKPAGRAGGLGPAPATAAAAGTPHGRLRCAPERGTIYEPGDSWLLDYSYQKGLLWRRDVEVSERGAVSVDFASFQNGAHLACTGHLDPRELASLRAALERVHPCALPTAEPRLGEDRGYVGVRLGGGSGECRSRLVRQQDMRMPFTDGRRFDEAITGLVSDLVGPGGVDPFDSAAGVLAGGRGATAKTAQATARSPSPSPASAAAPPKQGLRSFMDSFAKR
jgi:hypothetical protein